MYVRCKAGATLGQKPIRGHFFQKNQQLFLPVCCDAWFFGSGADTGRTPHTSSHIHCTARLLLCYRHRGYHISAVINK